MAATSIFPLLLKDLAISIPVVDVVYALESRCRGIKQSWRHILSNGMSNYSRYLTVQLTRDSETLVICTAEQHTDEGLSVLPMLSPDSGMEGEI